MELEDISEGELEVCKFLLPYKQRPATSTATARSMIQFALGSDKKLPAASKVKQDRLREEDKSIDETF